MAVVFLSTLTVSCHNCAAIESERQTIVENIDLFAVTKHCSALNNEVRFFVKSPRSDRILLGSASDLEESVMFYDLPTHTIVLFAPDPSQISLATTHLGPFFVKKARLHAGTPREQELLERWSANPKDVEAMRWLRKEAGIH